MAQVIKLFQNLAKFYSPNLDRDRIEKIYENSFNKEVHEEGNGEDGNSEYEFLSDIDSESVLTEEGESVGNEETEVSKNVQYVEDIPMVQKAKNDPQVLSNLLELCTAIRSIRESNSSYDNTYDCWDRVIEVSSKEKYLSFIYTLIGLTKYDPKSKIYRKLSIAAARTYFMSLTIPGAKGFHIFDDEMIGHAIEVFHIIEAIQQEGISNKIPKMDRVEIWVNLANICDDLKIMFRYVHFDEYKECRDCILWELTKILFNNHVNGYDTIYAANLHSKCFEIFDEVTNAHNGNPEDTFMKIMRITYCLHIFPPSPKHRGPSNLGANSTEQFCEHISDWFIEAIKKSPKIVTKVLKHYIKCIVSNPTKDWRGEQTQHALDYAAKYDAALYTKCNESALPFLLKASNSDDAQARINATELLVRITLKEANVNWEVFCHEISKIPREVDVIMELINRAVDNNNNVKLKSVNGLLHACVRGSPNAKKIMTEGILFATFDDDDVDLPIEPKPRKIEKDKRYKLPTPLQAEYTFEGYEKITSAFSKLPRILYFLMHSPTAHVRRAAISLIEHFAILNPHVIYNTRFVNETSRLGSDPAYLVRKQALIMIDSVLNHYTNCYPVIYAWAKIIIPLFKDSDSKMAELAWECFRSKVFDNIRGIDNTNRPENFMPWLILRVLLSLNQRHFLQSCIHSAINQRILDSKTVGLIESHTMTSNSTEAWIMLSFIAERMKSPQPDALISTFIKSMLEKSWNAGQSIQVILEVLNIWLNDFSHTALNMAFSCIVNLMKRGEIPPNVVSKAFNFCQTISSKSEVIRKKSKTAENSPNIQSNWIKEVHTAAEEHLLENLENFNSNRSVIMSYLFCYTETNVELPIRPNQTIVHFVHIYLEEFIDTSEADYEPASITTLNQMIILAARFSLRDSSTANITCMLYRLMLKKTDRSTIVNNIIVCLTDLCKRHTQTVELALGEVLLKLKSPFLELRLITFKNLAQMVLQDLIKLRGNLLIYLLAALLDKNREVSNRATEFFMTYLETKNSALFHNCLLECPYVFNNYLNFDEFESFIPTEIKIVSPLKGDENTSGRRKLYKVFMYEQEETVLLMFFTNLGLIYKKLLKDPTIESPEGQCMLEDMLFIIKEICYISLDKMESKSSNANHGTTDSDENIIAEAPSSNRNNSDDATTKEKKNYSIPTMSEAMASVEKMIPFIPKITDLLLKYDDKYKEILKELTMAICLRFDNLTEFLQPLDFWKKYQNLAKQNAAAIKKQRQDNAKNSNNSDDVEEDADTDTISNNDSAVSMLFKPFLV